MESGVWFLFYFSFAGCISSYWRSESSFSFVQPHSSQKGKTSATISNLEQVVTLVVDGFRFSEEALKYVGS